MGMLPPCCRCGGGARAPGCSPRGSKGCGAGASGMMASVVPAAALLALPREGACRHSQGTGMAKMCLRQVWALGQL